MATCHPERTNNSGGFCKNCAVRRRNQHYRSLLILVLGGKCVRCGINVPDVLCIDHIDGGGNAENRKYRGANHYKRIYDAVASGKYQLLCANCNLLKAREEKEFQKVWNESGKWRWK